MIIIEMELKDFFVVVLIKQWLIIIINHCIFLGYKIIRKRRRIAFVREL